MNMTEIYFMVVIQFLIILTCFVFSKERTRDCEDRLIFEYIIVGGAWFFLLIALGASNGGAG